MSLAAADNASDDRKLADLRVAARHLVTHPLVRLEADPAMFRLIRRHEHELDRWFSQRLGYRLQVTADTARLFKGTIVATRRPLQAPTSSPRPFSRREYTMLALILAAVAAGPNVISLRDLVHEVRSAAVDAEVTLGDDAGDRRAFVNALRWLVDNGVAAELHDRIDRYISDDDADAVLSVRPDRVALLPLPALARATDAATLVDRRDQRAATRPWMRAWLVEEPVLYRDDLTEEEWSELRRRLGQEAALLDEMFGLRLEVRAEGVIAIDPAGELTDQSFPSGGTVGHASLLLIDRLVGDGVERTTRDAAVGIVAELAERNRRFWSKLADTPEALTDQAVALLRDQRLVDVDGDDLVVLPAAARYAVAVEVAVEVFDGSDQASLW
ncbi:MAG: TIGR02678 family protein [Acidimicrobiales bacterium]